MKQNQLIILEENFDIEILIKNFDYLKLNIVSSTIVTFLDLNISLDKKNNSLNFSANQHICLSCP